MTLKFIPPKAEKLPRYASYGAGQMKTHTSIGAAKQSLANRCSSHWSDTPWREGFILELVDGEWYTRYHVAEGTVSDDLPWKKEYIRGDFYGWTNYQVDKLSESSLKYYQDKGFKRVKLNAPETKEEYADWRVRVELEKRGIVE